MGGDARSPTFDSSCQEPLPVVKTRIRNTQTAQELNTRAATWNHVESTGRKCIFSNDLLFECINLIFAVRMGDQLGDYAMRNFFVLKVAPNIVQQMTFTRCLHVNVFCEAHGEWSPRNAEVAVSKHIESLIAH